jgi:integral membrane protein (TIGR01906 family)
MKTTARWLFTICLPVLLLTASISWAVNSQWLYTNGFETYGVARTTGLAPAELDKAAAGLIDYFNSGEELIDVTVEKNGQPMQLFNEREIGHLKDVKGLFRLAYYVLLGTLAYALAFVVLSLCRWRDRRNLARGLAGGGVLTLLLMVVMGIGTLLDFGTLFRQFHLLSFANDLWLLDPTRDYLVMLFPFGFWYDTALLCALTTAAGAAILGGLGWWWLRRANS